jgi:hypothetical protein
MAAPVRRAAPVALALAAAIWILATPAGAVGPYPTFGSCHVFPKPPASLAPRARSLPTEAAWNQDISRAPRDPRSAAYISYIDAHGGDFLHPDFGSPRGYGFPYAVVDRGQRRLPIHFTEFGPDSDRGPYPVPPKAPVEGGRAADGDRHVIAIDRDACKLYEMYNARFAPQPRPHWNAGSGAVWDLESVKRRPEGLTSADAAGLPIFPGLVRYDEAAAGRIEHAIRVTFDSTQNGWIHPASHCAGDASGRRAPPMGLRLRLKASYGLGHFSGPAKAIAAAMKRYGLIVADNGSNWYISGTSDRRWDDENLDQLKRIPGRAFEVVKSAARVHRC